MPRIAMSYAPAAPMGVTTLMSVGAVDKVLTDPTADYVKKATYVASGAYILGWLTKNQGLKQAALGSAITLYVIMTLTGQDPNAL
jgi:hypothetical protein